jgi:hypothetical protein
MNKGSAGGQAANSKLLDFAEFGEKFVTICHSAADFPAFMRVAASFGEKYRLNWQLLAAEWQRRVTKKQQSIFSKDGLLRCAFRDCAKWPL